MAPEHLLSIIQAIGLVYVGELVLSFLYQVVYKAMLRPGKNLVKRQTERTPALEPVTCN